MVSERLFQMVRDLLQRGDGTQHLVSRVRCYRAGYSREQRRRIERQLFEGEVRSVHRAVGTWTHACC